MKTDSNDIFKLIIPIGITIILYPVLQLMYNLFDNFSHPIIRLAVPPLVTFTFIFIGSLLLIDQFQSKNHKGIRQGFRITAFLAVVFLVVFSLIMII